MKYIQDIWAKGEELKQLAEFQSLDITQLKSLNNNIDFLNKAISQLKNTSTSFPEEYLAASHAMRAFARDMVREHSIKLDIKRSTNVVSAELGLIEADWKESITLSQENSAYYLHDRAQWYCKLADFNKAAKKNKDAVKYYENAAKDYEKLKELWPNYRRDLQARLIKLYWKSSDYGYCCQEIGTYFVSRCRQLRHPIKALSEYDELLSEPAFPSLLQIENARKSAAENVKNKRKQDESASAYLPALLPTTPVINKPAVNQTVKKIVKVELPPPAVTNAVANKFPEAKQAIVTELTKIDPMLGSTKAPVTLAHSLVTTRSNSGQKFRSVKVPNDVAAPSLPIEDVTLEDIETEIQAANDSKTVNHAAKKKKPRRKTLAKEKAKEKVEEHNRQNDDKDVAKSIVRSTTTPRVLSASLYGNVSTKKDTRVLKLPHITASKLAVVAQSTAPIASVWNISGTGRNTDFFKFAPGMDEAKESAKVMSTEVKGENSPPVKYFSDALARILKTRSDIKFTSRQKEISYQTYFYPDFPLSQGAKYVIEVLQNCKLEVRVQGGAPRNILRGIKPHDYDLVVFATLPEIEYCFREQCEFRGEGNHQSAVITHDKEKIDVISLVVPQGVHAKEYLYEYAVKRDLTYNTLFWNPKTNRIEDYCHGITDLEHGITRMMGDNLNQRYLQEPSLILRTIRINEHLGFNMSERTKKAIDELQGVINGGLFLNINNDNLKKEDQRWVGCFKTQKRISEVLNKYGIKYTNVFKPERFVEDLTSKTPKLAPK